MKHSALFLKFLSKHRSILWTSILVSTLYGLFYYISIGYIFFQSSPMGILKSPNFTDTLFKLRAPFLWEPSLRLNTGFGLTMDIAIFNVLIGMLLTFLAFMNIALLITSIKMPKVCNINSKVGRVASMLPSFLSGFVCCAPTFVIMWVSIFGGVATTFLAVIRWALPFSIILLSIGAWQGLKKLKF